MSVVTWLARCGYGWLCAASNGGLFRPRAALARGMTVVALVVVGAIVTGGIAAAAPADSFQLSDLQRIVGLSDAQISPDGRTVAVVVSRQDFAHDRSDAELELVNVADGGSRLLTQGRRTVSSPSWAPDGKSIAFLAEDPSLHADEVYVSPVAGGSIRRLTANKHGVSTFSWSPSGNAIAFVAQGCTPAPKPTLAQSKGFTVTGGNFLLMHPASDWCLWDVPAAGGTSAVIARGDFSLATVNEGGGSQTPAWRGDGRAVAFTSYPGPYFSTACRSTIREVDADGGDSRLLVSAPGANSLSFSPLGNAYAFLRPQGGDRNNGSAVYVHVNGVTRDLTAPLNRDIDAFTWLPDGKGLILAGTLGTHAVLWFQPLSGPARLLHLGQVQANDGLGIMSFTGDLSTPSVSDNGVVAFIGSTKTHPSELYVMQSVNGTPRRLTDVNAFIDHVNLGRTRSVTWTGPGGYREDGVLTYPPTYLPGKKYPLVLLIHGGPMFSSTVSFQQLAQLQAAAGFLVFRPNYRGSNNLGNAYQHAIYRDTAVGPGRDVMAGIKAVEKLGIVDSRRIGVSGWSYGGFMTTWLTSRHTMFKAAVAGAPLTNWILDYTVSFYQESDDYLFGSKPFTDQGWKIWRNQSPIKYVRQVRTPTLLMGDVMDANVPAANAFEWYKGLQDNHVPVELRVYPYTTHAPHGIVEITDVYNHWIGWLQKYLDEGAVDAVERRDRGCERGAVHHEAGSARDGTCCDGRLSDPHAGHLDCQSAPATSRSGTR